MTDHQPCPCDSEQPYAGCCQPWHQGQPAPTPEALMRSRYSAYALGVTDYIMNTTYRENPEYRKNAKLWRQSLADYCRTTRFLGLTVLDGEPGDSTATVTFQARLEIGGKTFLLTEKSRFVKLGKRWLYHSGQPDLALTGDQGN